MGEGPEKIEGCTDPEAVNYNPEAEIDDGSCNYEIEGCTNPEAVNYNPEATLDDGSCIVPEIETGSLDSANSSPLMPLSASSSSPASSSIPFKEEKTGNSTSTPSNSLEAPTSTPELKIESSSSTPDIILEDKAPTSTGKASSEAEDLEHKINSASSTKIKEEDI